MGGKAQSRGKLIDKMWLKGKMGDLNLAIWSEQEIILASMIFFVYF